MAGANETYEIDIKAALPDGDSVSAKLDALNASILGTTKSAGYLDAAVKEVAVALAAAKAATADADTALVEGNAQWSELEANANRAAKAVEKASAKGAVPDEIAAQAAAAKAALDAYAGTLGTLESAAAKARSSEQALAIFLGHTRDAAKETGAAETAAAKEAAAAAAAEAKAIEQSAKEATAARAEAARAAEKAAKEAAEAASAPAAAARAEAREWKQLGRGLGSLPGPIGKIGRAFALEEAGESVLNATMGETNAMALKVAAGFGVAVIAIAAVTAAVVIGVVKIAAWAIGLADANRKAELATEAFNAMNPALAGLDFAGLTKDTGLSTAALQSLAKSLQGAGVAGDRMGSSLKAAALAQAALGPEAASQYVQLEQAATEAQKAVDEAAKHGGRASKDQIDALKKARGAADEFAATAQTKLGGIVSRQLLGLDAQSEQFSRNISALFGGLDIDPALEGLQKLIALFDQNSEAGVALKLIFDTVFQPIIDEASTAATAVEAFYLGVLIGAMKLYIALKPTIKAVEEFFGLDGSDLVLDFQTITKVGEALAPVFAAIALVIGVVLAAAFVAVGAVIAAQVAIWYVLVKAVQFAVSVISTVIDAVKGVATYLGSLNLAQMGTDLIMGFVNGIKGAAGAVVSAITGVVGGAIDAAKNLLGIHSPSKVFAEIGDNTAAGFTGGVQDASDAAQGAMAQMVSPSAALEQAQLSGDAARVQQLQSLDGAAQPGGASPAPPGPSDGASTAGGSSRTVHIENVNLGPGSGKEQAEEFVDWVTKLLEGDAAQAAGAVG